MMSWVTLSFEVGLATLMVALIVYCIKLNKRLSLLRNQNDEFADMIVGLREASERAEQSVQHLKAAGLTAEISLRSVIADAAVAQVDLSRLVAVSSQAAALPVPQPPQRKAEPAQSVSSAAEVPEESRRQKVRRDMLIGEPASPSNKQGSETPPIPVRPKTREEAEETVLQAIRSARVGT